MNAQQIIHRRKPSRYFEDTKYASSCMAANWDWDCDEFVLVDGTKATYQVGFDWLLDGSIDIKCFLNIDGEKVRLDRFEDDYVEWKLHQQLGIDGYEEDFDY